MALPVEIPASVVTGHNFGKRRTIRQDVNPFDKSTVVSILPKYNQIERKWTIWPGTFEIPYGTFVNPSVLVVGSSSWWADLNPDQPLIEIPVSSVQVAKSIVDDYCNACLGAEGDSKPGLFWIPGAITVDEVKRKYVEQLNIANARQRNWYATLVKHGDVLWARTMGNPLAISDDMRLAAKELGLEREWISDFKAIEMVRCLYCGNMRNPFYPVCLHCRHVVDKAAYEKLNPKQV